MIPSNTEIFVNFLKGYRLYQVTTWFLYLSEGKLLS